jgi:hypothetical protein
MFRATILPIIRSIIRLCIAACGMMHPVGGLVTEELCFQTTGRQLTWCITPQAALHSLMLLMMGKIIAQNMSSYFGFINKPLLLHLVDFLLYHRYLWCTVKQI